MEKKNKFWIYILRPINTIIFSFYFLASFAQSNFGDYIPSENIFSDDFSNNNTGWPVGLSPDNCYTSKIENGAFEITSSCKGIYPSYWMTRVIDRTRDFEIEANILFVKGEVDNVISLVWGKDDNFHRFNFGVSGNGQYKIFQYSGNWFNLKDWTPSEIVNKLGYNKLTVRKINAKYYFFLNEQLVLNCDFYPFYGNQIGFQDNQNTTMRVKYLHVSYLSPGQNLSRNNITPSIENSQVLGRFYIGLSADYTLLVGSFNGKGYFPFENVILVPKLNPGNGLGLQFGFKGNNIAVDWAYHISRMEYTTQIDGCSGTGTTHLIRLLGIKGFLGPSGEKKAKQKIKPYIDFDWSVAISHFDKISYSLSDPSNFKPANYGGMNIGLGIGTLICLSQSLAIDLRVLPEYYFGTDIGQGQAIKNFPNFLLLNSIGLNYYFKKKQKQIIH